MSKKTVHLNGDHADAPRGSIATQEGGSDDDDTASILEDQDEMLRARVMEIFKVFDQSNDNSIDMNDVGNVYRCLLLNVSQDSLAEIESQLVQNAKGMVSCDALLPRLLSALQNAASLSPPSDSELERAFQTILESISTIPIAGLTGGTAAGGGGEKTTQQPPGHNLLTKDKFLYLMSTRGDALTENERNEMVQHLAIRKNGAVDWRSYCRDIQIAIAERVTAQRN